MKKPLLIVLGSIIAVVVLVALILGGTYNSMVLSQQDVKNQQAQVEVVLQRRFDLIPNLVAATKGIMKQEQTVFLGVAEARASYAAAPAGSSAKIDAANQVETSLGRLLAIAENYPELKSDKAVQDLMTELAGSENRIAVERQRYNDTATNYNKMIVTFPSSIAASIFGFKQQSLFQSASGASVAPVVTL
jgi:LemA protein